ncbi:MAG TPA: Scr1 family TA system antitoxin-like transcriptional regulator, partial [Kineosporiaceae bacterium]|nr:Scr1 family TA system antitoxin-like transcriptional regulator [Kineosporiaceae bacterium]
MQTIARDRLAAELRQARNAAGLTGAGLAGRLGWDQPRVSRTERCTPRIPSARAVTEWAEATGADPAKLRALHAEALAEYKAFAKAYTTAGGAAGYQDALAAREAAATRILVYFPGMILGLVQTSAYARAILRVPPGAVDAGATDADLAAMVTARMRRQTLLSEPGRELVLLMGQAALHTRYVPDHVHRDQLHHLADLAEASNITATIGIVPFTAQLPVVTLHGWVVRDQVVTIE